MRARATAAVFGLTSGARDAKAAKRPAPRGGGAWRGPRSGGPSAGVNPGVTGPVARLRRNVSGVPLGSPSTRLGAVERKATRLPRGEIERVLEPPRGRPPLPAETRSV